MTLRILSVAAPLVSLFFFSAFAVAVTAPTCNATAEWQWTFNSLGQSPCTVLAYMMSTCNGVDYSLWQLQPTWVYPGPHGGQDNSNLCLCSTVGYSLFSACAACQNSGTLWLTWSQWVYNCTTTLPPSSFPNPVPSQIRVPQWVVIDVTKDGIWSPDKSHSVGDSPELGPGAVLNPSGVSTVKLSSSGVPESTSSSASPTGSPTSSRNSHTAAIAISVVCSVVIPNIFTVAIILYVRRRRSRARRALDVGASQPPMDDTEQSLTAEAGNAGLSLPNPGDPTAFLGFPGHQGDPTIFHGSIPSHNGAGSTLVDRQTSPPPEYQVLPMPTL